MVELARVRQNRRLTLRQVAAKAGLSYSQCSYIETGRCDPTLTTLRKYAYGVGVRLVDVIEIGQA